MKHLRLVVFFLLGPLGASVTFADALPVTSAKLTVFRTCVITGYPNTSTAVSDTVVKQDSSGSNFDSTNTMDVQTQSTNKNHRAYVKFDLTRCTPAIAATATVKVATLRLYMSGVPTACRTQDLFAVTTTWAAGTVTWTSQPFGTSVNNPASAPSATATVGSTPCGLTAAGYVSWTVTADVGSFVSGTATNYGWMIRDDVENASSTARTATYSTSHLSTLAQAPQLVVTYSP